MLKNPLCLRSLLLPAAGGGEEEVVVIGGLHSSSFDDFDFIFPSSSYTVLIFWSGLFTDLNFVNPLRESLEAFILCLEYLTDFFSNQTCSVLCVLFSCTTLHNLA